jgi:hypothetical protein
MDSSLCTSESCNLTTQRCTRGVMLCDDFKECTTDSCNPATGACVHVPIVGGQCGCAASCPAPCCINGLCLAPGNSCYSTGPVGGTTTDVAAGAAPP